MKMGFIVLLALASSAFVIWCVLVLKSKFFKKYAWTTCIAFALFCGVAVYYPLIPSIMKHDGFGWFHQLLLSFYRSVRLFLVDGDFPAVQDALKTILKGKPTFLMKWYQGVVIFVYLWAPTTTATLILSTFKNFIPHIWFKTFGIFKKKYIFSELNDKSLNLARDIRKGENNKKWKSAIIFHDVYRKHEEISTELLQEARKIGALCFKCDILNLKNSSVANIKNKLLVNLKNKLVSACSSEYFVIGKNESENIKQTLELVKEYKTHSDKKVYVWARSPESAIICDSLDLLEGDVSVNFALRRIDDVEIFVWNTLKDANLFDVSKIYEDGNKNKVISILIVGMGEYGMEFLKTAAWMYQYKGIKLEITAIDLHSRAQKLLKNQCPELIAKNLGTAPEGKEEYNIKFVENFDIFTFDLAHLKEKRKDIYDRLMRVNTVFVTLGADERNIRGALTMRQFFDQMHYDSRLKAIVDKTPKHKVEDEIKEEVFKELVLKQKKKGYIASGSTKEESKEKANKDVENIIAAGTLEQKAMELIEIEARKELISSKKKELLAQKVSEEDAKKQAKEYVDNLPPEEKKTATQKKLKEKIEVNYRKLIAKKLGNDYKQFESPTIFAPVYDIVKCENVSENTLRTYEDIPYNIYFKGSFKEQYKYEKVVREKLEKKAEIYHLKWAALDDRKNIEDNMRQYDQYEYYRRSSIAQVMYGELIAQNFSNKFKDASALDISHEAVQEVKKLQNTKKTSKETELKKDLICGTLEDAINNLRNCDAIEDLKESEHMRWCAYMRAMGYSVNPDSEYPIKLPRAMYHSNLVPYDQLDKYTKMKDYIPSSDVNNSQQP